MELSPSLNACFRASILEHWNMNALTDYGYETHQYKDVARKIEKLHILFESAGIQHGDKIALCGRNQAHWGVAFLAILTYGAVAVPILHDFHPEQVHDIVNHSEARLLFVGEIVWKKLDAEAMPKLQGIICNTDYQLLVSRLDALNEAHANLNRLFCEKHPATFGPKELKEFYHDSPEELAIINYTSGTTSNSKGVMIPYRAIWSNVKFADEIFGDHAKAGDNLLSMLPMAHTLGLSFEFLYEFILGVHIHLLTRMPTPSILTKALADVRPIAIVCVPLIIEKIVRKAIIPKISSIDVKLALKLPIVGPKIKRKICESLQKALGGRAYEIVIGGSALNQEVEAILHDIGFNYTVGYGATECAPIIAYEDWHKFVPGSCGKCVRRMELRIDSPDPQHVPGEILAKGQNVMLGYFKNDEATAETLRDGWYHTGDLGVIDAEGNLFIKGRKKNMLLASNGQNVYPEEIEDKLASLPYVAECIVVQRAEKFVGLVYPDLDLAKRDGVAPEELTTIMERNRKDLNAALPAYSQLSQICLQDEEFVKTPKKSIKRYLYK